MSNVIAFPKGKRDSPPQSMEELEAKVSETRKEHIEYLIDDMLSFVFARCQDEGFDLSQESCVKTTGMLLETFRAALYNTVGLSHPLTILAESMFRTETEMANGNLDPIKLTTQQLEELTRSE